MNRLKEIVKLCKEIEKSAIIDYSELKQKEIDEAFFKDYENIRLVNSFLFNFSKLQDKIGAKLFKRVLYELQEIDRFDVSMVEILSILEKLNILQIEEWQRLREIRNFLAHEYPDDIDERIENIKLAMDGFVVLQKILKNIEAKIDAAFKE